MKYKAIICFSPSCNSAVGFSHKIKSFGRIDLTAGARFAITLRQTLPGNSARRFFRGLLAAEFWPHSGELYIVGSQRAGRRGTRGTRGEDVGREDGVVGSAFNSRSVTSEALRH